MRPELQTLLELQEIDLKILALKKELDKAPLHLNTLKEAQAKKEEELNILKERLSSLQERKFEVEDELQMETERLKKSQKKLTTIKTEREYHALLKEIDEIKKANKEREDEILEAEEEIEKVTAEIEAKKKELDEINAQVKNEEKVLAEKTKEITTQMDALNEDRAKVEKEVQPSLLSKYMFLRDKRAGFVVVSVVQGVCGGCNMNIPPQLFNELLRDDRIYTCPTCQRFIYAKRPDETG